MKQFTNMIHTYVYPEQTIWNEAITWIQDRVEQLGKEKQTVVVFLSGGSLVQIYKEAIGNRQKAIGNVVFAQVDERFQPKEAADINAQTIERTGIHLDTKISQLGTWNVSADMYNRDVAALFSSNIYRIALLGIGSDGHTAGLLPGYEREWNRDCFAVGYQNTGTFPNRITLTPKALSMMHEAVVVAVGEEKCDAIQKIIREEECMNTLPGIILHKIPEVTLFTDCR